MEEWIDALAGDDGEGRIGTDDRQEGFVIDVEGFGFGGVFGYAWWEKHLEVLV